MKQFNLKYILPLVFTLAGSLSPAFVKTGIGTTAGFTEQDITDIDGNEDWCISRVLNNLTCLDSGNNPDLSTFFNDVHNVICSADVALAPIYHSKFGEIAKGNEKFGYKFWAYSFEVPAGNALNLVQNLPLYFLKSQVDGAINITTNNVLEDLKRQGDEFKYHHLMLNNLNELVKARDCSKRRFTTQFTKESIIKSEIKSVSECEFVVYEKNNSETYGHYCARVASKETILQATFPVLASGEISLSFPNSQQEKTNDLSITSFCGDSCYMGYSSYDNEVPSNCKIRKSSCEFKQKEIAAQIKDQYISQPSHRKETKK